MKQITLLIFIAFLAMSGFAQPKTIIGRVTTFEEIAIIGAEIQVKSSGKSFYTDSLGKFLIQCKGTDKLKIVVEGFNPKKVKVKENTDYVLVNLKLKSDRESKKLALGYVSIEDQDKLTAITSKTDKEFDFSSYKDIYEVLVGNFSGLSIQNGEVIIRNSSSFVGANSALLIVDGREVSPMAFGDVSTYDIANISVLKDASAAIYGSRGGNGVVVVETKRGKYKEE